MPEEKELLHLTPKQACLVYDCVQTVISRGGITEVEDLEAFAATKRKLLNLKSVAEALNRKRKETEVKP